MIREAAESDAGDVAELFDAYRVFYRQTTDLAAALSFIIERLRRGDSVIFLARGEVDSRTMPLGFVQLYPLYSSVSMKRLWLLNDLYVAPEGRRSGIAKRLIDRAKRLAVDTKAKGLILETANDNTSAQALYDSYGFVWDTEFRWYHLDI